MEQSFDSALELILKFEGGLADHPLDRGGLTNFGITQSTYDQFRRYIGAASRSVSKIRVAEVYAIYYNDYWRAASCHKIRDLDDKLALVVFDCAVNSGVGTATRTLQKVLGVVVDGIVGPITLEAVRHQRSKALTFAFLQERNRYYHAIVAARPSQEVFLKGWLNRISHLSQKLYYEDYSTATSV